MVQELKSLQVLLNGGGLVGQPIVNSDTITYGELVNAGLLVNFIYTDVTIHQQQVLTVVNGHFINETIECRITLKGDGYMINDSIKVTGELKLTVTRPDGHVKHEVIIPNLVVTTGKNYIASRMKDASLLQL